MFIVVTGNPGSGKSFFGVNKIREEKENYKNIYANINRLKMGDNVQPLNFNRLKEIIEHCKNIYDFQIDALGEGSNDNVIDAPIVEYLLSVDFIELNPDYAIYKKALEDRKNEGVLKRFYLDIVNPIRSVQQYKPTLIIMDEAHNHMPSVDRVTGKAANADPVLLWWVSYHRHLYMDVILLSQYYQKIHGAYLRDVEYFLNAVESTATLLGKHQSYFKYNRHMGTPFYKTNLAGSVKVKKDKALFDMYESGDAVRTKSVILPYLIFAAAFAVVALLIFGYVASTLKGDDSTIESLNDNDILPITSKVVTKKFIDYSDFKYLRMSCVSSLCNNKDQKIFFDIDDLEYLLSSTDSELLSIKKYGDNYASVTLMCSKDFINLFKRGDNEKISNGFSIVN